MKPPLHPKSSPLAGEKGILYLQTSHAGCAPRTLTTFIPLVSQVLLGNAAGGEALVRRVVRSAHPTITALRSE